MNCNPVEAVVEYRCTSSTAIVVVRTLISHVSEIGDDVFAEGCIETHEDDAAAQRLTFLQLGRMVQRLTRASDLPLRPDVDCCE
jgi:hypothetical protein